MYLCGLVSTMFDVFGSRGFLQKIMYTLCDIHLEVSHLVAFNFPRTQALHRSNLMAIILPRKDGLLI